MVHTRVEDQVRTMLYDTIVALCRNSLPFKAELSIEGLLGITLDKEEIFLVNIKEMIHREGAAASLLTKTANKSVKRSAEDSDVSLSESGSEQSSSRRKRKRPKPSRVKNGQSSEEDETENVHVDDADVVDTEEDSNQIKQEIEEDSGDLVFVKSEPADDHMMEQSFLNPHDASVAGLISQPLDVSHLQELSYQISSSATSSLHTVSIDKPTSNLPHLTCVYSDYLLHVSHSLLFPSPYNTIFLIL